MSNPTASHKSSRGLALMVVVPVIAITGLVGLYVHRRDKQPLACKPGYAESADGRCVPGAEPVDKYARCIVQDAKEQTKGGADVSIEAKLRAAKAASSTTAQLRDNFEKTIEKVTEQCFLHDVSARCFVLAGGVGAPMALPDHCRPAGTP